MSSKKWGYRAEPTRAQYNRMVRLHEAMAPFRKSVTGYKKLRELLPAYLSIYIGVTLKECAVSVSTLTDEKPAVLEALIKKLQEAAKPKTAKVKSTSTKRTTVKSKAVKTKPLPSTETSRRFADSMTMDEINRIAPYTLKQLKNGDWAIRLGAIQYMRFEGIVWARYYCETLNSGYRDILRDLKESKAR